MNISITTTLFNEKDSVLPFFESLLVQTVKFDELVIVDGGSTDGTWELLKKYSKKHKRIKIYRKKGNISVGRNTAVKHSKNEILVFIDGGCVAKRNWLNEITKPFKDKNTEVVAGFYEMKTSNVVSEASAPFHGITPRRFNPNTFMPSARSFAIKRSTYEKIGGFNEELYRAGEDTLLNYTLLKAGIKFIRAPRAIVYWNAPLTFTEIAKKSYYYALGDAQTRIWWHPAQKIHTHSIKIVSIYLRYLGFLTLSLLSLLSSRDLLVTISVFSLYLAWSIWKLRHDVRGWNARLLVPIIQVVSDFSVMMGFATGLLRYPKISV